MSSCKLVIKDEVNVKFEDLDRRISQEITHKI
jgi:hypothetical protein